MARAARHMPTGEDDGVGGVDIGLEADGALDRRRRRRRRSLRSWLSLKGAVGPPLRGGTGSGGSSGFSFLRLGLGLRPGVRDRLHGKRDEGDGSSSRSSASSTAPPVAVAVANAVAFAEIVSVLTLVPRSAPALVPSSGSGCLGQLLRGGAVADHADEGRGLKCFEK